MTYATPIKLHSCHLAYRSMQFVFIIYCDTRNKSVSATPVLGDIFEATHFYLQQTKSREVLFQIFVFVFISTPPSEFLHHSGMNVSKVGAILPGRTIGWTTQSSLAHTHDSQLSTCLSIYTYLRERSRAKSTVYLPSYHMPGDQVQRQYWLTDQLTN